MAEKDTTGTVLKILSGVQSGVDVVLHDGDYTLGSDDDDDIQLFDVSLKSGHARLSIHSGKIEIAGEAGQLRTGNGLVLEPGGDLQEIEPLDIVIAGTTRFALGPRTANWDSITAAEDDPGSLGQGAQPRTSGNAAARDWNWRSWQTALPIIIVLLLMVAIIWIVPFGGGSRSTGDVAGNDLERVKTAIEKFDFAERLTVRQEIDGVVYVTGYVEQPVERRAVLAAVRDTEVPARVRISVLEVIRNEVSQLLEEADANLTFTLSDEGALTLSGVIFDPEQAEKLVSLVRDGVSGISSISSQIRTGPSLLVDVQKLAEKSHIDPLVLLRLNGNLIEASGILPSTKIDAWVGFLQAYASRFAPIIPLRSLVQLQNPDGSVSPAEASGSALFLGGETAARAGDRKVDVDRLRSGDFQLGDIFIGQEEEEEEGGSPGTADQVVQVNAAGEGAGTNPESAGERRFPPRSRPEPFDLGSALGMPQNDGRASDEDPAPVEFQANANSHDANSLARRAIQLWRDGKLDDGTEARELLQKSLEALDSLKLNGSQTAPIVERYAPLLASTDVAGTGDRQCWRDSLLTRESLAGALFWLDVMSVSAELSVVDLEEEIQALVLDAALSPRWTRECAAAAMNEPLQSIYLHEITRNPDFIRFITRDYAAFPMDVTGAHIVGERYLQTRTGRKLGEGAAPDEASRLLFVGELGAVVERADGLSIIIFEPNLSWLIR